MFDFRDLFQWDRFVTPSIIKIFYWLAVIMSALAGMSGVVSGLLTMAFNPFSGMAIMVASVIGAAIGMLGARILAEFVLITFRINDHLGAMRNRNQ